MNEYYGSNLASSDFFAHYGVKGMKWGVRRYQNKDGSLNKRGIRKVTKKNLGYLNPTFKDKRHGKAENRNKVGSKYSKEYWDLVEKGMPENDHSKEGKKLWDKYKDAYASAVLKDLKMRDSKTARKSVKKALRDIDIGYNYNRLEHLRGFKYASNPEKGTRELERIEKLYASRRNQIIHPVISKIKTHSKRK